MDIEVSPKRWSMFAAGIYGHVATASIAVNSIPKVLKAVPGLHTRGALPLPSFFPGKRSVAGREGKKSTKKRP